MSAGDMTCQVFALVLFTLSADLIACSEGHFALQSRASKTARGDSMA
jgi:hypothetical protein